MEISYGKLYKMKREIARKLMVETYLKNKNISETARLWKTSRNVVRKWVRRYKEKGEEGLKDLSHIPRHFPNITPPEIEEAVLKMRKDRGYGRKRLAFYLYKEKGVKISPNTIRHILRRGGYKGKKKPRRIFYPAQWVWENRKPFSLAQVDTKHVLDKETLGTKRWDWIRKNHLPKYQWTFLEGKSRFRFLCYSRELSVTNGIAFNVLLMLWLRKWRITELLHWQTDWGEEFGGSNPEKIKRLNDKYYAPLNAKLNRIPKGKKEYNGRVERSHRTDDEEFYLPFILDVKNEKNFLSKAQGWQYIYNVKRAHFGEKMNGRTPLQKLKECGYYWLNEEFAMFPVLMLDDVSTEIVFNWGGNELLTMYMSCIFLLKRYRK